MKRIWMLAAVAPHVGAQRQRALRPRGEHQMPPLGSAEVDTLAAERVRRWIATLEACD